MVGLSPPALVSQQATKRPLRSGQVTPACLWDTRGAAPRLSLLRGVVRSVSKRSNRTALQFAKQASAPLPTEFSQEHWGVVMPAL